MQITKKLIEQGGSKLLVLPADWLKQYGDITEVLLTINGSITITPLLKEASRVG